MASYVATFLVSGATVTAVSYIGNHMNPLLGGIVSGIPISIPTMLLIRKRNAQVQFIASATLMLVLLTLATVICYVALKVWRMSAPASVALSVGTWVAGAAAYYLYAVGQAKD